MNHLYRGMDRTQLDAAYNNTKAVKNFSELLNTFQYKSSKLYAERDVSRNIPYFSRTATTFDHFSSHLKDSPTLIFIHGGYWQNCKKEDFAFIASGLLAAGVNVVLAEYTLAPEASMTQIVQEIGLLLDYLQKNAAALNITPGKVCLSGHSAGGHLTAMHRGHPFISHAMPISALVDLQPISLCWLNDKLSLSEQEIAQFSPVNHVSHQGVPTHVHVGGGELSELIRHSQELYQRIKQVGDKVQYGEVGKHNHFSLLNEFEKREGYLVQSLLSLLEA